MDSDYLLEWLKLAALRNCQQSYSSISVTRWLNLPGNRHFGRTIWQNGSSLPTTLRPSHLSNFEHLIESYHGSAPHIQTSESTTWFEILCDKSRTWAKPGEGVGIGGNGCGWLELTENVVMSNMCAKSALKPVINVTEAIKPSCLAKIFGKKRRCWVFMWPNYHFRTQKSVP